MERLTRICFMGFISLFVMVTNACSQPAAADRPIPAVFVASTPCSAGTRPLPGIPKDMPCELIKWKLQLVSGEAGQPTGTYILDCNYGMPKQGTRGFIDGGKQLHREGKWTIIKGAGTNPEAVIYQLDPDKPHTSVSFLRLNKNLIHLLDSRQRLMIGTGAWSYTLNRIQS